MGNKKSKNAKKNDQGKDGGKSTTVTISSDEQNEENLIGDLKLEEQFKHRVLGQKQLVIKQDLQNNIELFPYFQDSTLMEHFKNANIEIDRNIHFRRGKGIFCGSIEGQEVAIKIVDLKMVDSQEAKHQKNEVEHRKKMKHRGIIKVHYMGLHDNIYLLVMDFAAQNSLKDVLDKNGPFVELLAMVLFNEIIKAVEYMHKKLQLAHRHLMLEHILYTEKNIPKLTGFKYVVPGTKPVSSFVGDAYHLAPEVLHSEQTKTPYWPFPADEWALGVCLFQMTNDGLPHKFKCKDTDTELAKKTALINEQLNRNVCFRDFVAAELSADFKKLIMGLLEPDIRARLTIASLRKNAYVKSFERGKAEKNKTTE